MGQDKIAVLIRNFNTTFNSHKDEFTSAISKDKIILTNSSNNFNVFMLSEVKEIHTSDPIYNYDKDYIETETDERLKVLTDNKNKYEEELENGKGKRDLNNPADRDALDDLLRKIYDAKEELNAFESLTKSVDIVLPGYSTDPVKALLPLFRYKIFKPKEWFYMCTDNTKIPKKLYELEYITYGLDEVFDELCASDGSGITKSFLEAMFILMKTVTFKFKDNMKSDIVVPYAILTPNLLDATHSILKWCILENDKKQKAILGNNVTPIGGLLS